MVTLSDVNQRYAFYLLVLKYLIFFITDYNLLREDRTGLPTAMAVPYFTCRPTYFQRQPLLLSHLHSEVSGGSTRLGLAALQPLAKGSIDSSESLYDNSFSVVGPWNILTTLMKNEDTITLFKAWIYSFCSRYPDTPPLRGKPAPQHRKPLLKTRLRWTASSVIMTGTQSQYNEQKQK